MADTNLTLMNPAILNYSLQLVFYPNHELHRFDNLNKLTDHASFLPRTSAIQTSVAPRPSTRQPTLGNFSFQPGPPPLPLRTAHKITNFRYCECLIPTATANRVMELFGGDREGTGKRGESKGKRQVIHDRDNGDEWEKTADVAN